MCIRDRPYIYIKNIDPATLYPIIQLEVSISDRNGESPADINEEHIRLYEDGFRIINQLKVERMKKTGDILYLVFSIDSSRSISKNFLSRIKTSASHIVNSTGSRDRLAVYRFNDEVKLIRSFSTDKKRVIESIKGIRRHGSRTLLYNSLFDSLEVLDRIEGKRKAVIVFTDGKDEGSSVTEDDIIKMSKSSGLPIYFICLKTSKNIKKLARISKLTGGRLVYSSDKDKIAGIYKTVLSFIKKRYLIKYRSALKRDGKDHSVEVKLKYDRLMDSHSMKFGMEKSLLEMPADTPVFILLSVILFLIIIIIFILIFFIRKAKRGLYKTGEEMPAIRTIPRNQADLESSHEPEEVLLSDDPEFTYSDAWLVEKSGPETGSRIPIYFNEVILGRSEEASIVIKDDAVSLKHAKIKATKKNFYLYDLVSENGTFLNGNKLLRPKPLYDWDIIKIGRTELIFRGSKTDH
jgi:VWFA-related protein